MQNLTTLVSEYIEVRSRRLALEQEAEDIKKGREKELKQIILQVMASQGIKSANVEGLGKVVSKETSHFEIRDINLLVLQMFKNMIAAGQQGRPLSDALLLQRRVHADNLSEFLGTLGGNEAALASSLGVQRVVKTDLSFTKG